MSQFVDNLQTFLISIVGTHKWVYLTAGGNFPRLIIRNVRRRTFFERCRKTFRADRYFKWIFPRARRLCFASIRHFPVGYFSRSEHSAAVSIVYSRDRQSLVCRVGGYCTWPISRERHAWFAIINSAFSSLIECIMLRIILINLILPRNGTRCAIATNIIYLKTSIFALELAG